MSDESLRDHDITERLLGEGGVDEELRPLGNALRKLRTEATAFPIEPDHRLGDLFDSGVEASAPPARRWLQRPAIAFGAAFIGVLLVGGTAIALVNRGPNQESVAAGTTPSLVTTEAPAAGEQAVVAVPEEVGESVAEYLTCVITEVGSYVQRKFGESGVLDRPRVHAECGIPAVPSLGEGTEDFRVDLNSWLACASESFDKALPQLITDPSALDNPLEECGDPPDPFDYGITFDFDGFDLRFLEDVELPDIDLEGLFDRFSGSIPQDFLDGLPPDSKMHDLDELLEGFRDKLPEDFDLDALLEQFEGFKVLEDLEGFENFDPEQIEELWRDLATKLLDLDGLLDGFLEGLPEDFDFGDLGLWFNGELFHGDETCHKLLELGLVDECDVDPDGGEGGHSDA